MASYHAKEQVITGHAYVLVGLVDISPEKNAALGVFSFTFYF